MMGVGWNLGMVHGVSGYKAKVVKKSNTAGGDCCVG